MLGDVLIMARIYIIYKSKFIFMKFSYLPNLSLNHSQHVLVLPENSSGKPVIGRAVNRCLFCRGFDRYSHFSSSCAPDVRCNRVATVLPDEPRGSFRTARPEDGRVTDRVTWDMRMYEKACDDSFAEEVLSY